MNPFVFVVGCPRSGTTLLQRMLDAHPELAVTNDTHFIPRALRDRHHADAVSPELVERVVTYHRFGRLGVDPVAARRLSIGASSYAEFVGRLYDEVARSCGKRHAGEKTPDYVRHVPLLHVLFPRAKFVHIVRDGRDVALSTLQWARPGKGPGRLALWHTAPVAVCALWWARFVVAGRTDGAALGADVYHEVRYERLVDDPEPVLRDVASFLGLAFDERMVRFSEGHERHDPGLSAKKAWRPPTPGLRDWATTMNAADVATFEALVGRVLDEFGYRRSGLRVPVGLGAQVDQWREDWLAQVTAHEGADSAAVAVSGFRGPP